MTNIEFAKRVEKFLGKPFSFWFRLFLGCILAALVTLEMMIWVMRMAFIVMKGIE